MKNQKALSWKLFPLVVVDRVWRKRLLYGILIPVAIIVWLILTIKSLPNPQKSPCLSEDCESAILAALRNKTKGKTRACHLPKLETFEDSIKQFIISPEPINCESEFPLLFQSTLNSVIVPVKGPEEFRHLNIASCCYNVIERGDDEINPDDAFSLLEPCYPLSLKEETVIPEELEFIAIVCKKVGKSPDLQKTWTSSSSDSYLQMVDAHAFVPLKAYLDRVYKTNSVPENGERLNVLLLGVDSVSRMTFKKSMPKSYRFLMEEMSAIEMRGYSKIGDSTFPCMAPALMGLNASAVQETCEEDNHLDTCPYIWTEFSKKGYRTSFCEDASDHAIFNNFRKGFRYPPTDYFFRPFQMAIDNYIGHTVRLSTKLCKGPRLGFQVVLDYLKKFVTKMTQAKRPYFQFSWTSSLTHDFQNYAALGDDQLLETLEWLAHDNRLNNTIMVFLSDHGARWGELRETLLGSVESRVPVMYFILPQWFRQKFPRAYVNLKENEERLTTALDLHSTLLDILDLAMITNSKLLDRENQLALDEQAHSLPHGISLFLPVPLSRTCEDTEIEENFCLCNEFVGLSSNQEAVKKAARYAVKTLNELLVKYPNCAYLDLKEIRLAHRIINPSKPTEDSYLLNFMTTPGNALFEALVSRTAETPYTWRIGGSISRINYRNQSACIADRDLVWFCHCLPR